MRCPNCFNHYDHSLHEPYFLSCHHTFCISCLKLHNLNECPGCTTKIQFMHSNSPLLKIISESNYDKSKSHSLTILNQTADLIASLNLKKENKIKENLEKIQSIKNAINTQANKLIQDVLDSQKKLISEAEQLESELKNSLSFEDLFEFDENIFIQDNIDSVTKNELSEQELTRLSNDALNVQSITKDALEKVEKFNESFEFSIQNSTDLFPFGKIERNKKSNSSCIEKENKAKKNKNFKESLTYFDKALNNCPQSIEEFNHKVSSLGQFSDKVTFKYFDYFNKAHAMNCLEKYELTMCFIDKAIAMNPDYAPAYFFKGILLNNMKKYDESIRVLNKTIELDSNSADAYVLKGDCLLKKRDFNEALNCYSKAANLSEMTDNCEKSEYLIKKGNCLMILGEYKQAIECFDESIQFKSVAFAFHLKGLCLKYLQHYAEAIDCFDQALKLDSNCASFYDSKGVCLLGLQEFREANKAFNKAIQIEPINQSYRRKSKITTLLYLKNKI